MAEKARGARGAARPRAERPRGRRVRRWVLLAAAVAAALPLGAAGGLDMLASDTSWWDLGRATGAAIPSDVDFDELSIDEPLPDDVVKAGFAPDPEFFSDEEVADGLGGTGIPEIALEAYEDAADLTSIEDPECGVPWSVLAAIGRVESDHGRFGGAQLRPDGYGTKPIRGVALDGGPGIALVRDTDRGSLDGDTIFDRAVGPMQIIPLTWSNVGVDGNGDDRRDPNNIYDRGLGRGRVPVRRRRRPHRARRAGPRRAALQPHGRVRPGGPGPGRGVRERRLRGRPRRRPPVAGRDRHGPGRLPGLRGRRPRPWGQLRRQRPGPEPSRPGAGARPRPGTSPCTRSRPRSCTGPCTRPRSGAGPLAGSRPRAGARPGPCAPAHDRAAGRSGPRAVDHHHGAACAAHHDPGPGAADHGGGAPAPAPTEPAPPAEDESTVLDPDGDGADTPPASVGWSPTMLDFVTDTVAARTDCPPPPAADPGTAPPPCPGTAQSS